MTPEQVAEYSRLLEVAKVAPERVSTEWEYQRAWNDGIAYAERQFNRLAGADQ